MMKTTTATKTTKATTRPAHRIRSEVDGGRPEEEEEPPLPPPRRVGEAPPPTPPTPPTLPTPPLVRVGDSEPYSTMEFRLEFGLAEASHIAKFNIDSCSRPPPTI